MYVPDNFDMWHLFDNEQERQLDGLPVCADCDNHVQNDHYYLINDKVICPDCMDSWYRRDVEYSYD